MSRVFYFLFVGVAAVAFVEGTTDWAYLLNLGYFAMPVPGELC